MKFTEARWLLSQINRNPIFGVLLGGGALFFMLGLLSNVFLVAPPEEQRKIWFLDLAGQGWSAMAAGVLGCLAALGAFYAWPLRYLFLTGCILLQGLILTDEFAQMWTAVVMLSIMGAAVDYIQSD